MPDRLKKRTGFRGISGWFGILLLVACLGSSPVLGEGIRELRPDSAFSSSDLHFDNGYWGIGYYTTFGLVNCPANNRLYIHIKEPGEIILFGLRSPRANMQFNFRKPDGTIALSGICPTSAGQTGFIRYYHQAVVGPFPALGGYSPFSYQVSNIADTGDYYFEIANLPLYQSLKVDLWDFQVVSGTHTPAIPADMINGRVWSQSWQVNAELAYYRLFNGRFFVYSNDGIVTKLTFDDARVGVATIFCNPYGCLNTGNFTNDRKSVNANTYSVFPGIADYKVFLNDPDSTVYSSGTYGQIIGTPSLIPDPSYPPCNSHKLVAVNVNKTGTIEVTIVLPYGTPSTTVTLYGSVLPGFNYLPWDGLDGQGNPVPDGTVLTITVTYLNGLTNLPIWDQEQNPNGYTITLVRPENPAGSTPLTYWDDTNIPSGGWCPSGYNFTGCLPTNIGCHTWSGADCHDMMINTWWYASSSITTFTAIFFGTPAPPVGYGDWRCGPGSVLLHATPPPASTIDWYDTLTGGLPLLTGDTTFNTPVLFNTTTFYAEARNDSTSCVSSIRVPVVATIVPAPIPTISGPDSVCAGTSGHSYQTEPGNSNYEWWVTPGGFITSGNGTSTVTVSWLEAGQQTIFVNYTNPSGCPGADPAAYRVIVLPLPDTAGPVTGPTPVCAGTGGVHYSTEPVQWTQSYVWSVPPGFSITAGNGTNSITVSIDTAASSGEIRVYGTNACGDGLPSPPFPVTVIQPPVANAGPDDMICQGSSYTVTGATASGFSTLHWISDGSGELLNAGSLTPMYLPTPDETGKVTLTLITESPPCTNDSSSMSLYILPGVTAEAGENLSTCYTTPVLMEGASAGNYQALLWTTSGSGAFDNPCSLHPFYLPSKDDVNAGTVVLTLTVYAHPPCTNQSDSRLLTFSQPPSGEAGPDAIICQEVIFHVTGATAQHFSTLRWEHTGKGVLREDTTLTPVYYPSAGESGMITLTLSVYGSGACWDSTVTDAMTLRIFSLQVDAGPDQSVDSGAIAILTGFVGSGTGNYSTAWEPATLVVQPWAIETVTYPLTGSTWFFLSATDRISGCSKTDSVLIQVKSSPEPPPPPECLEIYNVITPNGDGLNDTWIITCIEQYPDNTVLILNRWGDRIRSFERYDNISQVWDGTNRRGEPVPDGTYYYVLTIRDMKPKTGWIFVRGGSK